MIRAQAVKLVLDHRDDYESEWAAITWIASKSGMAAEMLRKWSARPRSTKGAGLG